MDIQLTQDERAALAGSVMRLLDSWKITSHDQVRLLGLADKTKPRVLARYRQGTPLPEGGQVTVRAHFLLNIGRALDTSFPHNPDLAAYWVITPSRVFGHRTPLEVMLARGLEGIECIHGHLYSTNPWG